MICGYNIYALYSLFYILRYDKIMITAFEGRDGSFWKCLDCASCIKYSRKSPGKVLMAWWCHQMETFPWPFVRGIYRSPVNSPYTWSFDVSLVCAWTNGWPNNRDAGDLRRHRAHYDVICHFKQIMSRIFSFLKRKLSNIAEYYAVSMGDYSCNNSPGTLNCWMACPVSKASHNLKRALFPLFLICRKHLELFLLIQYLGNYVRGCAVLLT